MIITLYVLVASCNNDYIAAMQNKTRPLAVATFVQLNHGWNADPNSPNPRISVDSSSVLITFYVNAYKFPQLAEGTKAILRFKNCQRYRLGATNDEGWYLGQCRFSGMAPAWGEFFAVSGESGLLLAPVDWVLLASGGHADSARHHLFYFKDETFECVAEDWEVQLPANQLIESIFISKPPSLDPPQKQVLTSQKWWNFWQ